METGRARHVFVGIGSNSGDRYAHMRAGIEALPDVIAISPLYASEAVGNKHGADEHLNAVVLLNTTVPAQSLLQIALDAERAQGRNRQIDNVPVPLDIDLLLIQGETHDSPGLTVPHPRMWSRRFVLAPLSDLNPALVTSGQLAAAEGNVRLVGEL